MSYQLPNWSSSFIPPADRLQRLPVPFFSDLAERVQKAKEKHGEQLNNLAQGSPDLPTPDHIVKALQHAAENPVNHKYSPFTGFTYLKEAIAKRYAEDYGVTLDPDKEVAVLFGSRSGLVEISQCYLNPGELCLVPDPGYPDYWSGIHLTGAQMVRMPLLSENRFLPDYTRLDERTLDQAKLMFLNYPNNPTSVTAPLSFYEQTVALAKKHRILIASDFAYGAFGFDGKKPVSFLQAPGAKEVGVEFYTLSKTYNMAGWRVAFALGSEQVIRYLNFIQDHYYCSLFGAIQEAAEHALAGPQDETVKLARLYEARRDDLFQELKKIGWEASPSQGTFYAWLPVPEGCSSESFAQLLIDKAGVIVVPGSGFGDIGEGFVRVGLNNPKESLIEAVGRIGELDLF